MSSRTLICVACPVGCAISVDVDAQGGLSNVSGNRCKRGHAYAVQELTCPTRTVTAVVPVEGAFEPLSVKTAAPVPKDAIFDVLAEVAELSLSAPVAMGQTLIDDVCHTGVAVVATKTVE